VKYRQRRGVLSAIANIFGKEKPERNLISKQQLVKDRAKKSPLFAQEARIEYPFLLAYNYLAESAAGAVVVSTGARVVVSTTVDVSTPWLMVLSIAVESPEPEVPALLQAATNRPRASAKKPTFFILNVFKVYLK
jgi:hypothetical protein